MTHTHDIEVHFNCMGGSGGTMVVVAVGTDVYGATGADPVSVLHAAASNAATDLTSRGRSLDARDVVERGMRRLAALRR